MDAQYDHIPERAQGAELTEDEPDTREVTRAEAAEERRQAAEHGDYHLAERWLWHEQLLAAEERFREQH